MNNGFRIGSAAIGQSPHVLKETRRREKQADGNRTQPLEPMETPMFTKTTLAAAALATAIAAQPMNAANAAPPPIDFQFSIETPHGTFSFGNGGFYQQPASMNCWQANQYLKGEFKHVNTIECNGSVYTFKVKKLNIGPWKTVKLNKANGQYWFV
jgi:hypothetical protein